MMSISYYLLDLTLKASKKPIPEEYRIKNKSVVRTYNRIIQSLQKKFETDQNEPIKLSPRDAGQTQCDEEDSSRNNLASWCTWVCNFLLERQEYNFPEIHGWRIRFRRIFLFIGTLAITITTFLIVHSNQTYSAKKEIQTLLNYIDTNLTWPDEGSALDDVFALYTNTQQYKCYIMVTASVFFWFSMAADIASYATEKALTKQYAFTTSRIINFFSSLLVFASVILVGLPDYLEASHLDRICPYCGHDFNHTVKHVAEFSIGLFFACLFTFQLLPILMMITLALVRASVLILVHPKLRSPDKKSRLQIMILHKVVIVSSVLCFPATFVSMSIIHQQQKDIVVTMLIVLFWVLPPLTLYLGLYCSQKYQKNSILLCVYYLYNLVYVGIIFVLMLYSFRADKCLQIVRNLLGSLTVWSGGIAQLCLCNVVISDMLYMTVF
jgi:hypothetical protein